MDVPYEQHNINAPSQEAIDGYYAGMRKFWYPVLTAAEVPDYQPVATELLAKPLVVARLNGDLVCMDDVCRHFQAQLSLGEIREIDGYGECLMCPYHGWSYEASGQCVDIPQISEGRKIPAEARVSSYPTQERYGLVWVCLEQTPLYGIPELPGLEDPNFLQGPLRTYEPWVASAPRAIMAALDDTHGAWVHEGLVGDRAHPEAPDHKVRREGQNLVVNFTMLQPNNATIKETDGDAAMREVMLETTVGIPNTIHFDIRATDSRDKRVTIIWQAVSPRRYNKTDTYWGSARNYDMDQPAWNDEFEQMQDTLREQDKEVVESQRPWIIPPFWTKIELPLRPSDLPLIEYQRWLEELDITIGV